jgi:hypothetical protein
MNYWERTRGKKKKRGGILISLEPSQERYTYFSNYFHNYILQYINKLDINYIICINIQIFKKHFFG